MKNLITFSLCLLFAIGCSKDKECSCKKEKPYNIAVYEFQFVQTGTGGEGCGPVIEVRIDSLSAREFFKPVNLPSGISFSLDTYYKGIIEVLPEQYKCIDGRIDPNPNLPTQYIYPHFVNILEWEKK